ncbi:hypothetical protein BDW22DRAFT_925394 [Trametopsis cervina]|nr:hypothetical protein BDW22DRAFT_925394 [Trametopsis cervina]
MTKYQQKSITTATYPLPPGFHVDIMFEIIEWLVAIAEEDCRRDGEFLRHEFRSRLGNLSLVCWCAARRTLPLILCDVRLRWQQDITELQWMVDISGSQLRRYLRHVDVDASSLMDTKPWLHHLPSMMSKLPFAELRELDLSYPLEHPYRLTSLHIGVPRALPGYYSRFTSLVLRCHVSNSNELSRLVRSMPYLQRLSCFSVQLSEGLTGPCIDVRCAPQLELIQVQLVGRERAWPLWPLLRLMLGATSVNARAPPKSTLTCNTYICTLYTIEGLVQAIITLLWPPQRKRIYTVVDADTGLPSRDLMIYKNAEVDTEGTAREHNVQTSTSHLHHIEFFVGNVKPSQVIDSPATTRSDYSVRMNLCRSPGQVTSNIVSICLRLGHSEDRFGRSVNLFRETLRQNLDKAREIGDALHGLGVTFYVISACPLPSDTAELLEKEISTAVNPPGCFRNVVLHFCNASTIN